MTNGVVSIVEDGRVAMKLVTGHDGMHAPKVAERLKALGSVPSVEVARAIALDLGFGCADCIIVGMPQDPMGDGSKREDHDGDRLRYWTTFNDPRANPRWEHEAPYTEVVEFDVCAGEMEAAGYPKAEACLHNRLIHSGPEGDECADCHAMLREPRTPFEVEPKVDRQYPYCFIHGPRCMANTAECVTEIHIPMPKSPFITAGDVRRLGIIASDYRESWVKHRFISADPSGDPAKAFIMDFSEALQIVAEVHGNQRDKFGESYVFHLARVAARMETDEERVVAWLHDALEDSASPEVWTRLCARINIAYGMEVTRAVLAMSRIDREPYVDYLLRVKQNPLALKAKRGDLADNSDPARLAKLPTGTAERLRRKYEAAKMLIGE